MYMFVKRGVIVLLSIFTFSFANAQQRPWCATPNEPSKWTESYLQNRGAFEKSGETLYVPLTIHLVGTDDGTGYLAVKNVLDALCALNEDYLAAGIQFYQFGGFRYINRTIYYEDKNRSFGAQMHNQNKVANTINIYIVENAGEDAEEGTQTLGYATAIGGDGLVIVKSEVGRTAVTLPHEMGHVLGLYHTFFGWEASDYKFEETTPDMVSYNRQVERVDGSNCAAAADGLCDTKPDYLSYSPWNCNAEGLSTIVQKDQTGTTFRSDGTNFMSYSQSACQNRFSEGQNQLMRAHLTTTKRNTLNRTTPLAIIDSSKATLQTPANAAQVNFASVALTWNTVPSATFYLVEVSRLSNFAGSFTTSYLVKNNNSITLTDLANNRTYYWRVRAFNEFSFCSASSTAGRFQTVSTTPTVEIAGKEYFNIYPNVITANQSVNIQAELPEQTRLNVRLFDLSGKMLQSIDYEALAGETTLQFNPGDVAKGIYILNITTNRGTVVDRLVIQ